MNNLSVIIDEKSYRFFKGTDWPTYEKFISNDYTVENYIQAEIDVFVAQMQEKYNNIATAKTVELSLSNQKRQSQVFYDKKFNSGVCRIPWNTLGVNSNGNVFICQSPSWIPIFVGNLFEVNSIYDILNSDIALKIRQEILAGRYYYCNTRICSFFDFKDTKKYQIQPTTNIDLDPLELKKSPEVYVNRIPTDLIFDFDYTCNFKCPSCRTEVQNWNADHIRRPINDRLVERIKRLIIDEIKEQSISIRWCGGEPFMSDVYIELFNYIISTEKTNIQNIIQTNGSLFEAKKDLVKNLLPYVSDLRISFDAGCAETYALTRVGGDWNRLIRNTEFIIELIKEHKFKTKVSADYVVQKNNYKDLPKFVELCNRIGVKINLMQKMWNWGTWDEETFDDMNVYNPEHPLYEDLKTYFKLAKLPIAKN